MSCESYRESFLLQLTGELSGESEKDLLQHLENCDQCKKEFGEFGAILSLMQHLPEKEWDEKLRIQQLLRRDQRWRAILFSKAALWLILLTAAITALSYSPVHWKISANEFSVRWGDDLPQNQELSRELKNLQVQLSQIQRENQNFVKFSEERVKQLVDQTSIQQEKRYWQTLEMFTNYMQAQRKADLQKIQHDIATTYDRTGHEVEKTNELLEYVLRTSASEEETSGYEGNK